MNCVNSYFWCVSISSLMSKRSPLGPPRRASWAALSSPHTLLMMRGVDKEEGNLGKTWHDTFCGASGLHPPVKWEADDADGRQGLLGRRTWDGQRGSGGIRPQHPWCSAFSTSRNPTSVADWTCFRRVLRTTNINYEHSNICLPVKHGTCSGFSKYRNPSSVRNSGGIRPECAT